MFMHQFFFYTRISLVPTHLNIIHVFLGVVVLNSHYDFNLGFEEVLFVYTLKKHHSGKFYFMVDTKSIQLVMNLSDTSKNKPKGNVII